MHYSASETVFVDRIYATLGLSYEKYIPEIPLYSLGGKAILSQQLFGT